MIPTLSKAFRPIQVETDDLERFFEIDEPPSTALQPVLALAAGSAIAVLLGAYHGFSLYQLAEFQARIE